MLDMRLAFAEGWGNAWSGMALGRDSYTDSLGPGQAMGTFVDLAAGEPSMPGWFREASVQAVLWRLYALHGFGPLHDAISGPLRTTPAVTSIHSFAAAYAAALPSAQPGALVRARCARASAAPPTIRGQRWRPTTAACRTCCRCTSPAGVGAPVTVCVGRGPSTLGSYAYLRLAVPLARTHQIVVSGPPGSDPDFTVYAGAKLASARGPGRHRNGRCRPATRRRGARGQRREPPRAVHLLECLDPMRRRP